MHFSIFILLCTVVNNFIQVRRFKRLIVKPSVIYQAAFQIRFIITVVASVMQRIVCYVVVFYLCEWSSCFPEEIHNHSGCIWVAVDVFLWTLYVINQVAFPEKIHDHCGCICVAVDSLLQCSCLWLIKLLSWRDS